MTYGKLVRTSYGFDISWSNDHLIKADGMILGEIDARTLLYYSFTDKQLATYDMLKTTTSFVKMVLHPVPALMQG